MSRTTAIRKETITTVQKLVIAYPWSTYHQIEVSQGLSLTPLGVQFEFVDEFGNAEKMRIRELMDIRRDTNWNWKPATKMVDVSLRMPYLSIRNFFLGKIVSIALNL